MRAGQADEGGGRPVGGVIDPAIDVSVVIPARNEVAAIGECLAGVLAQDWPHDRFEVVVVDGGSVDGTAGLARQVLEASGLAVWQVLVNPDGATPSNLNHGLAAARGRYLCRVDARSFVPPDYVRRCVEVLRDDPEVRVVGGRQVTVAPGSSPREVGIARALNNRFAMGGARYRAVGGSGPVDTVYLGAFRADEVRAAGGWDVRFPTNQDFELNRRMVAGGGVVWFVDGLEVGYRPRAMVRDVLRQYLRFGKWKVRYWRLTGDTPLPRQVVLLAAPPVAGGAGLVLVAAMPRRGRGVVLTLAGLAALAIEHLGSRGPSGGLRARLWSVVTMACVGGGWSAGVWREWTTGRRSRSSRL